MSNAGPHGDDGPQDDEFLQDDDEVRQKWEREIRAWLRRDGAGAAGHWAEEPVLPARPGAGSGARWSSLLATYIDSLSRSALQDSEDVRGYVLLKSLDERPPGGSG